ncbi:MAG: MFS transporter [Bacteroidaceae bacterium]|nr:MFS transporter [Bacteroidaceae bacterium]
MSQNNSKSLVGKGYLFPFILVTSLFFLWGFARAILDVLNKHFQTELDISISQSAMIQVTTYLCYFLMAIPAGMFINRYGYRKGVVLGLLLFAAGSLLFIPGNTFVAYLGALAVIGCGLTFLETAANPYATELGPKETSTSRLNLSQSFNGLGSIFAPLILGNYLFSDGGDVTLPYTIMGIMVFIVALIFSKVKLPEIVHEENDTIQENTPKNPFKQLFSNSFFVLGLIALLSYEVSEISINSYFINFTTGMGWLNNIEASNILALALAFFMIGRFLGSWIMCKIKAEMVMLVCATGSVICMILVLLNIQPLSIVGLIGNYVFEAIMFPTIFALTLKGLGNLTKTASSILMMTPIGGCGFLLMSYIADATSLVLPFAIPLAGFILVWIFSFSALHRSMVRKS